ncbi:MAG: hypothetical protein QF662_03290, partial [Phycisphaerae bacterium]|nr:hypothetical protein [Phycisphaerae bacterium]
MRFDASMQVRMEQRMILAPRMIQAMEILQLPLLALERRIEQELVSNPVLEMREISPDESPAPASDNGDKENPNIVEAERALTIKDDPSQKEEFARLDNLLQSSHAYQDYFDEDRPYGQALRRRAADEPDPKFEALRNAPAPTETLHEHLSQQLAFVDGDPFTKEIAGAIVRNLDDNGYLLVPIDEIVHEINGTPDSAEPMEIEEVERALEMVQGLEPVGVGAR